MNPSDERPDRPAEGDRKQRAAEPDPTPGAAAEVDPEETIDAATAALTRARRAARDRGLRPGSPAIRKRRAGDIGRFERTGSKAGRDPLAVGDQVDRLVRDRDWRVDVAAGAVMGRWVEIVGPDVSQHSAPISFQDGILTVRAETTAWATQLRLLSNTILGRMENTVGAGVVVELKVVGPAAPSWSRGLRRTHGGRGPRDTYG